MITSIEEKLWVGLSKAAEYLDVSDDTILRRAVPYNGDPEEIGLHPCPEGKVRCMQLNLGKGTRQQRRYYLPDLNKWLN